MCYFSLKSRGLDDIKYDMKVVTVIKVMMVMQKTGIVNWSPHSINGP